MKAERHAARKLHDSDRAAGDIPGFKNRDVAAILCAAIDHRQNPAIAFLDAARNKYRFAGYIAWRERVELPRRAREIEMRQRIERHLACIPRLRSEPAMPVRDARASLVKTRKFSSQVVDDFPPDGIASAIEIHRPMCEACRRGLDARSVRARKQGRPFILRHMHKQYSVFLPHVHRMKHVAGISCE